MKYNYIIVAKNANSICLSFQDITIARDLVWVGAVENIDW